MGTPQAGIHPGQVTSPKLESLSGLKCMFQDGDGKLEYLEEAHTESPELELNTEPSGYEIRITCVSELRIIYCTERKYIN